MEIGIDGSRLLPPWEVVRRRMFPDGLPNPKQFAKKYNLNEGRVARLFAGKEKLFWHELCSALSAETGISAMAFYTLSRIYSDNLPPTPLATALALPKGPVFLWPSGTKLELL